jgi:hypothetical protein
MANAVPKKEVSEKTSTDFLGDEDHTRCGMESAPLLGEDEDLTAVG